MVIKFNLQSFERIPEGERKLTITEAKCTPSGKPNCLDVTFKDVETGRILNNKYKFDNNGGLMAMGFLCRIALNIPDLGEFDTNTDVKKLIGKTIIAEVVHTEGTTPKEDGSLPIFANIKKVISLVEENKATTVSPRNQVPIADDLD